MSYVTSPASLVYPGRGAGTGAAVVFRNSNAGSLSIFDRSAARRAAAEARALALKQRQAHEDFAQYQALKTNPDTAPIYQSDYNTRLAAAHETLPGYFTEGSASYVANPFARRAAAAAVLDPLEGSRQLELDDQKNMNTAVAAGKAKGKGFDALQLEKDLYNSHYENSDPTTKKLIAAGKLPAGYHEAALADPKYLVRPVLSSDYFKGVPASQQYSDMVKGKRGTYAEGDMQSTKLGNIIPDGKGGFALETDANGRLVPNDLAGHMSRIAGTDYDRALQREADAYAAQRDAAIAKNAAGQPLTSEERMLIQTKKDKSDFFVDDAQAFITDTHKHTKAYIPLLRPRASSGGGFAKPSGELVEGDYPASVAQGEAPGPLTYGQPGATSMSLVTPQVTKPDLTSIPDLGATEAAAFVTKSGESKEIRKKARFVGAYSDGPDGKLVEGQGDKVPVEGRYGQGRAMAVDAKTGKVVTGKSRDELKAMIAKGEAKPQFFVERYVEKNSNFAQQYEDALAEMVKTNSESVYPKSLPALEAAARAAASKGEARQFVPYTGQNAQQIDAHTGGHYRKAARAAQLKFQTAPTPTHKPAGAKSTGVDWN